MAESSRQDLQRTVLEAAWPWSGSCLETWLNCSTTDAQDRRKEEGGSAARSCASVLGAAPTKCRGSGTKIQCQQRTLMCEHMGCYYSAVLIGTKSPKRSFTSEGSTCLYSRHFGHLPTRGGVTRKRKPTCTGCRFFGHLN